LFLPRIGQEVVVSYLNGDPSRPLVTGSVYNGTNTTPVKLPDHQTQSTIATWSSKQGTAGNIVRFEDKKDAEQLYFHAQKDLLTEI
jgi:type VI secretion system secreted protein VgrG